MMAILSTVVVCFVLGLTVLGAAELLPLDVVNNALGVRAPDGTFIPKQFRGVTGTGGNFRCVQGYGIFDGPTDVEPYMSGMRAWHIDIVRVPMNEDCWLGINGVKPKLGGSVYQAAMVEYVTRLVDQGFYVILTLHWSAPGNQTAFGQSPMPDADHSATFWAQVGRTFGQNRAVIFDVHNEPYPDDNAIDSLAAWTCWKYGSVGGNCSTIPYAAIGFDALVRLLRSSDVNATNVLMLGGINYANSLTRWLEYVPHDPLGRLAASWHSYSTNHCNFTACWQQYIEPVAAAFPLVTGELGELDCRGIYITPLTDYLDELHNWGAGTSYLAWVWEPWSCDLGPALITNYSGACTDSYGCTYRQHLLTRHSSP